MKMGCLPGTGNHKGCPYNRFAGAYFHSNDDVRGCLFYLEGAEVVSDVFDDE